MTANTITNRSHEELVRLAVLERPGFLAYLQGGVNLTTAGLVYAGVINAATAGGGTEGTAIGGSGSNTLVALTGDTLYACPISVEEHQVGALDFTNGNNIAGWADEGAGALVLAWQNAVIAALTAGTYTGRIGTLPSGQERFIAESDSEQLINENQLNIPLAKVRAVGGYRADEVAIIMDSQSYQNFSNGRTFVQASQTRIDESGDFPRFRGSPIFEIPGDDTHASGATNFGGSTSGEAVAFVVGRKGYSFHTNGPLLKRSLTDWNDDGFYKVIYAMAAQHGIRSATHIGKVVNT